jgi:hypothetical protein
MRNLQIVTTMLVVADLCRAAWADKSPQGSFAVFADCPLALPGVALYVFASTESGEFVLVRGVVPIMLHGRAPQHTDGELTGNQRSNARIKYRAGLKEPTNKAIFECSTEPRDPAVFESSLDLENPLHRELTQGEGRNELRRSGRHGDRC